MVFTPDLKTSLRSGQSSHRPEVAASGHTDLAEVTGPDGDLTKADNGVCTIFVRVDLKDDFFPGYLSCCFLFKLAVRLPDKRNF